MSCTPVESLAQSRRIMQETGHWSVHQQMGRRWAVGCIALEITQRCNLDCSLCYLSEHSEAVKDIPLSEIFRRIDQIHDYYGPYTDIQVTGGDPTLRKREELVAIIRRIHGKNMRSTLMTNGIRATRSLLQDLADAGLDDVALHIDTTQERKGYKSEKELNVVRKKYIDNARGLGLSILFNTTIHSDNFHEIPALVEFFIQHAGDIRTVSFQLQADTGRGTMGKRAALVTPDNVWQAIESAARTRINFNAMRTGHPACNRYGMGIVVNNRLYDLLDKPAFVGRFHAATAHLIADRRHPVRTIRDFTAWLCVHPYHALIFLAWLTGKLATIARDLVPARGRVTTLSFFIHNFMNASDLDPERIHSCVFKTMTADGPLSMCQYNASRDDYILESLPVKNGASVQYWHPLSGAYTDRPVRQSAPPPVYYPLKYLKGRSRKIKLQNTG